MTICPRFRKAQWVVTSCLLLVAACAPDPDVETESKAARLPAEPPVSSNLFARVGPVLRPAPEPALILELEGPPFPAPLRTIVFFGDGLGEIPWMEQEVRLLDSQGITTSRHGGYVSPMGLGRHGDELLTWDSWTQRMVRLDAGGAVVAQIDAKAALSSLKMGFGGPLGTYGNELALGFWGYSVAAGPTTPSLMRYPVTLAILDVAEGTLLRSVELPGEEQWAARMGNSSADIPVIFGRSVEAAVAHGGTWIADTDSLVFRLHTGAGVIRELSFDHAAVPVQPEWVQAVQDSLRGVVEDPERRIGGESDVYRVVFEAGVPARATLPAFSRLLGGADGRLWIREFPIPGAESVLWVGLDEELRPEVRMELPLEMEVLDIDNGRVLVGKPGFNGVEILALEGRP